MCQMLYFANQINGDSHIHRDFRDNPKLCYVGIVVWEVEQRSPNLELKGSPSVFSILHINEPASLRKSPGWTRTYLSEAVNDIDEVQDNPNHSS